MISVVAKPRLAIARLWHEGNSFSPVATTLNDFRAREWAAGEDAQRFYRGTATELGAAVAFAEARSDWNVTFLRCAAAPPAGPVADAAFEAIRDDIVSALAPARWDAVYLSLHGALITPTRPAADLDLLRGVRRAIGNATLAASFDLHANLGAPVLDLVDVAVGYRTYPHTDMHETGARALSLLERTVGGRVAPVGALAKLPAILPSFNMRTTDGPMAEAMALADRCERRPGILAASLFGGFAYGDSPHAGPAALVYADGDRAAAEGAAAELIAALAVRRQRFRVSYPAPEAGIAQALSSTGTVAVLDPADNPLSGGIGDTPGLFRALLAARAPGVFAFFCDPAAVEAAKKAGLGAAVSLNLGGRLTEAYGPPVPFAGRVALLTDGRFVNRGPMERNLPVDLGPTAVVEDGQTKVILTARCVAPNDPAYFALHGIDLDATRLLCVKAKNHFRAAFSPMCRAIVEVDAPGPASPDLTRYPYRHVPPGMWPLNERGRAG